MNEQLIQRIRQCPTLPTLPTVAIEVLELAQDFDADIAQIAAVIAKDPALTSKILRTVNSSFYGRSQNVSTISHALVILGLQSVKTLVLGFSLVSNLKKQNSVGFNHLSYWKRSVYAATAARSITAKLNIVQQEEAFLAGLLKDIGMLVLDQVLGEAYGEITSQAKTHAQLVEAERQALGMTHADVGGVLAEQWKLPPLLATPIAMHHSPENVIDGQLRKLTELIALAGHCADVFVNEQAGPDIMVVRQQARGFRLSDEETDALLSDIGKRTREVAGLFEINLGPTTSYDTILKKANETLIELTLQSQMQASQLQQQNQKLVHQVTTDALTGLANRARFDQFLVEQFQKAAASKKPLSLLMLDLDKFKSVNDTHGHPAGDAVLKAVAKLLQASARKQDLAARYGGEEMALVLPETPRAVAAIIADTLRRAVAAKPVDLGGGKLLSVTTSIGVASYEPGSAIANPSHLIKAADTALYQAKKAGRNCVKVLTLKAAA